MGKIIITKMISSEPESMPEKAIFTDSIEISNDEKVIIYNLRLKRGC
jgi:hypothetical protein